MTWFTCFVQAMLLAAAAATDSFVQLDTASFACRETDGAAGAPDQCWTSSPRSSPCDRFDFLSGIRTEAICKQVCKWRKGCTGIEFRESTGNTSVPRCEVWLKPILATADITTADTQDELLTTCWNYTGDAITENAKLQFTFVFDVKVEISNIKVAETTAAIQAAIDAVTEAGPALDSIEVMSVSGSKITLKVFPSLSDSALLLYQMFHSQDLAHDGIHSVRSQIADKAQMALEAKGVNVTGFVLSVNSSSIALFEADDEEGGTQAQSEADVAPGLQVALALLMSLIAATSSI